ncbi:phosphotransferase family protein [Streptosporangium sp. NPDC087985]|uniref:phosphotransferase family protein n=1 Tax=Streptosporangium sp. NPDC087985 TaxID=3366196 RepID=UPI0037FF8136
MGDHDPAEVVRGMVAAHLPGYRVDSVVWSGEGYDNVAYEVNGELIVRFSKEADPAERAARVDHEARLLAAVARISPLPVPEPRFTVAERGCLAYAKVPGLPLLDMPHPRRLAHGVPIAATLGELLSAVHAVPVGRMSDLVETDDHPLSEWRREAAEIYGTVAGEVPAEHRPAVEAFLNAPPPDGEYAPVFSHNDLGIEHVLVDPVTWEVTGVIDWSDAAITDPAYDFGLIHRDLGPAALDAAVHGYRTGTGDSASLRERAVFYARCSIFEDLAYGLETGQDRYTGKSLASLEWLFPAEVPR